MFGLKAIHNIIFVFFTTSFISNGWATLNFNFLCLVKLWNLISGEEHNFGNIIQIFPISEKDTLIFVICISWVVMVEKLANFGI